MPYRTDTVPACIGCVLVSLLCFVFPLRAFGQVAVVVPLAEAEFESPALPPPVWLTNDLVMHHLVLLTVHTLQEKQLDTMFLPASLHRRVTLITSYDWIDGTFGEITLQDNVFGNSVIEDFAYDGNAIAVALKLDWQFAPWSIGVIIPYQHLDLDSFDADRIGAIGFARYNLHLTNQIFLRFVLNGTYMFNEIDSHISSRSFDDFNSIGANVSVALGFDTKELQQAVTIRGNWISTLAFIGSIAASYQVNKDDAERESIHNAKVVDEVEVQQLVMLGGNVGMRIDRYIAVTAFGTWTYDGSDYDGSLDDVDKDYFDLGAEIVWNVLPRWRLHGRYKKVLGYDELDVDHLSFGVTFRF